MRDRPEDKNHRCLHCYGDAGCHDECAWLQVQLARTRLATAEANLRASEARLARKRSDG